MKKLMLMMIAALFMNAASANDKPIKVEELPAKAQEFIKNHFPTNTVTLAKEDTDFAEKSYEVVFSDGSKVEFNKKGDWKDVEYRTGSVPVTIIPTAIIDKVKTSYPNTKIVKIEKDRDGYDIKLSNGTELEFNSKLQLIDID